VKEAILIAFLSFSVAGPVPGLDLGRPPTPADRAKILAEGWQVWRDTLGDALVAGYQPGGPLRPGSTGVTSYRSWLLLWRWCDLLSRDQREEMARIVSDHLRLFPGEQNLIFVGPGYTPQPGGTPPSSDQVRALLDDHDATAHLLRSLLPDDLANLSPGPVSNSLKPEVAAEWVNDEELSRLVFETLSDHDFWPGVVSRLQEIRDANPQKFREYRALAVALAVVYDQKFPSFWPHHQVDPKLVPVAEVPVADRFKFWTESNESGALFFDLRQLSPGQIKFVVDAPVRASELDWARRSVRYQRSEFAKAFDAVVYSSGRMKTGNLEWKTGEYTLENIYHQSGICVDQAYYAMVAGKARGLPTLFFTGQGTDGGHAWFGYMKAENRWELDCGRYRNQNYVVGQALDPQTWLPVSDHELEIRAKGTREGLEFFSSQNDVLMGRLAEGRGNSAKALRAYESAMQVCPQNWAGWVARADYLQRSSAPANVLKAHYEAALRQFATNKDQRVEIELALAQIAKQQGSNQEAENMERQAVAQNKRARSDLSVKVVAQRIKSLLAEGRLDDALAEYRRQVLTLGKTGGGNLFYDLVQPFAADLITAGHTRQAAEALSLARKALKPEGGSLLDSDLRKMESLARQDARP
jgi:tetratricopeptide (TPR) repeat protein